MGRTNLIILCFGLVACVALSLMMRHVADLKSKHDVHPLVAQLDEVFGSRLRERAKLKLSVRDGKQHAELRIKPKTMFGTARLARSISAYTFECIDGDQKVDSIEIVAEGEREEATKRFLFDRPLARTFSAPKKKSSARQGKAAPAK